VVLSATGSGRLAEEVAEDELECSIGDGEPSATGSVSGEE
jgi:hypothetical protein